MDGESRSIGNGGVFTKEYDFFDDLAGGFLPSVIQVVLFHYALVVDNHPDSLISKALHVL